MKKTLKTKRDAAIMWSKLRNRKPFHRLNNNEIRDLYNKAMMAEHGVFG